MSAERDIDRDTRESDRPLAGVQRAVGGWVRAIRPAFVSERDAGRHAAPRSGSAPRPTESSDWQARALLFAVLPLAVAAVLGVFLAVLAAAFLKPASAVTSSYLRVPVPRDPTLPQSTHLYDREGRLITTLHAGVNRTEVPLSQMPERVREAVIAIEDKNFYSEGGISLPGIVRATLVDLMHGEAVQGGSTITQQYVKLVFTGGERTISRKLREVVLAQKISRMYSKDEILERYLNTVYFGNGAYGLEAAARTYWHIPASRLSALQGATLAAMIQAPETYNPYTSAKLLRARRNVVLQYMGEQGYLEPGRVAKLQKAPLRVLEPPRTLSSPAAYFVDYVRRNLQRQFGVDQTFSGGLRVTTTLDAQTQQAAEDAVSSHLTLPTDPAAALVAIDPSSGAIRAMVGGKDFSEVKFNLATQAHRQTGSAFKPFTLAAAMEQRISPYAVMSGPPELIVPNQECYDPTKDEPWDVNNYADETAGTMSLLQATAHSVNTIYAQLVVSVGPESVVDVAHRMGVRSHLSPVCSITLGSQPVTPLEMTTAYATLAARGTYHPSQGIARVTTAGGEVIGSLRRDWRQALLPNDADLVTYALQGVVTSGTGTAANPGRPAAGKTGTAQDYQDAWFCGYVPQLAACVWVGYPRGEIPMHYVQGFANVFGGSIPAMIWHDFMVDALADVPIESFTPPSFTGYDQQPERIAPLPAPSPSPSPTPSASITVPPSTPPPDDCHGKDCSPGPDG